MPRFIQSLMQKRFVGFLALLLVSLGCGFAIAQEEARVVETQSTNNQRLKFDALPDLPDAIGVAGPIVGVHNDALIVAGGANFASSDHPQLWDLPKLYHDRIWSLHKTGDGEFAWREESTRLEQPMAYSAVVNTNAGVLVIGGEDSTGPSDQVFLLKWSSPKDASDASLVIDNSPPDLPFKSTACTAALVDDFVYFVAGNVTREGIANPTREVYRLNVRELDSTNEIERIGWKRIPDWPNEGEARTHAISTSQHDGFANRLYVIGGRRFAEGSDKSDLNDLNFFNDVWSFAPGKFNESKFDADSGNYDGESPWRKQADSPVSMTAGAAVSFGPSHIVVLAYADGSRIRHTLDQKIEMRDYDHPGFPKTAYAYHTITDTWTPIGQMPAAQVTTPAVKWGNEAFLISGEIRPRISTAKSWRISIPTQQTNFGTVNMLVLVLYLLAMLGVGLFFTMRNKSADDYFRGGKNIAWWVAGCSIFATMLSSITYMAVPAKAFAQDWVYAVGNILILAVAPIAIFVALPFFRRIDATSAYEYLELRFSRVHRLLSSGSFILFHIFRMGVVLALAALALASITPLSPAQCVIVMGVLSLLYCTLGGIEAVLWTDTIQTFVLMGGAILCMFFAFSNSDVGSFDAAIDAGKFHLVNVDFGSTSFMTMAIWVVVLGGFGQNIASYTADQAVVQRYMTTPDTKAAARSIWFNGFMAIFAGVIFFGMGTAFWMFYRSHPELLDPSIATDRIMPLFISQQLPIGLAGLVVAGIFAAAQSTVSTSMNSGSAAFVTDFANTIRGLNDNSKNNKSNSQQLNSERQPENDKRTLAIARASTFVLGILGMLAGLLFVDPQIKSLFDAFIGLLGMFLGVIAGLFALGGLTRRATSLGSLLGAVVAICFMAMLFLASKNIPVAGIDFRTVLESVFRFPIYQVNGYLYAFIGISVCFSVGYVASLFIGAKSQTIDGLTIWNRSE